MLQRLISILLVLIPVLGTAQSITRGNPEYEGIVKNDCQPVFTKTEELPTFKISKQAFEDSLTVYLKANHAFNTRGKFTLQFLLTRKSQILDLTPIRGSLPNDIFTKAFLHYSKLWLPAKQNYREVCAFVKCAIQIKQEKLIVKVYQ